MTCPGCGQDHSEDQILFTATGSLKGQEAMLNAICTVLAGFCTQSETFPVFMDYVRKLVPGGILARLTPVMLEQFIVALGNGARTERDRIRAETAALS